MKKKVAVIGFDPRAAEFYGKQIQALFDDYVEVNSYGMRDGTTTDMPRSDLYIMSKSAFEDRADIPQYIPIDAQISEILVGYTWETVKRIQEIPAGTKVLFVNMTEKMVREATTDLNQLGVNHIRFIPFYPGAELKEEVELAITPDEERYVPKTVKRVMNIGHRSCTPGSIIEIALKLNLESLLETKPFVEYFRSMASSTYSFDRMFSRTKRLESQFDILMGILDVGIIGVNEKMEIFAINEKAEEVTGLKRELVLYNQAAGLLPYLPLPQCLKTRERIGAKVVRINGVNVGAEVVPVLRREECIGAFAILQRFNDSENKQHELRTQLMNKGYRAKYTFEDVIGESGEISKARNILRRMARTESPVLLIGETGTGKELFAHAVHQTSRRVKGPFVAINCGAMPENLLESELFGYEEGAFTGAKKGGRPGLFEFAHMGTLFLDEVEGMSPALQVKLLRVLQEHEIMRIGGNKIISVDVRIVAATNESLEEKVEDGSFRRDLYYRLNTLPVLIPPLRQRADDVFLLLERFRQESEGEFILSEEVKQMFREYRWPGNIRELRNVAEYLSFTGSPVIGPSDLPPTFCCKEKNKILLEGRASEQRDAAMTEPGESSGYLESAEKKEWMFVLGALYENGKSGKPTGREGILEYAGQKRVYLSQTKVRAILGILKELGLVKGGRGRGGCHITPAGIEAWERKDICL